jgi:hypothetical protein
MSWAVISKRGKWHGRTEYNGLKLPKLKAGNNVTIRPGYNWSIYTGSELDPVVLEECYPMEGMIAQVLLVVG